LHRADPQVRGFPRFGEGVSGDQQRPGARRVLEGTRSKPSADIVIARDLFRTVYGEGNWDTHPVSHLRHYEITRDNLVEAVKLLAEAQKIVSKANVNVVGLVPVAGENLSNMSVSYQFRSIEHWGEAIDAVGTSDDFQALVAKAAKHGTLRAAFTMIPL
jgi:hypothetical protein